MKRMRILTMAQMLMLVGLLLLASSGTGCQSLTPTTGPTTGPLQPLVNTASLQADLNFTEGVANLLNAFGVFTPAEWQVVLTTEAVAQATITAAEQAQATGSPDYLAILNEAADAVQQFKLATQKKPATISLRRLQTTMYRVPIRRFNALAAA